MMARITRILILLQLAVAVGLYFLATRLGHVDNTILAALLAIGAVLLFRALITANNFFLAWIHRSGTPATFKLSAREACGLFAEEFCATMSSSSWFMPFRTVRMVTRRAIQNPPALPVLLIHGYACNSGYWWAMSKALMRADITHQAIDIEPIFGDIDAYVPLIHHAVEALCHATGKDKIVIVAHSMGGLAARAYLRAQGSARIAKIITLATPHHGTGLAAFSLGINGKQMQRTGNRRYSAPGAWLTQLADSENDDVRALFVSLYSHHDNIVSPQTSAHLPGAKNIEFHGIGHVALALNPAVQARVIEEIRLASDSGKVTVPMVC